MAFPAAPQAVETLARLGGTASNRVGKQGAGGGEGHQLCREGVELVDSRHVETERVGEGDEGLDSLSHVQRRWLALVTCHQSLSDNTFSTRVTEINAHDTGTAAMRECHSVPKVDRGAGCLVSQDSVVDSFKWSELAKWSAGIEDLHSSRRENTCG